MLRLLVLLLLLLNGLYFAWSRGDLVALGWTPARQEEPDRLAQQIAPQRLRVLSAAELGRQGTAAAPVEAAQCLVAGLFNPAQAQALRQALLSALPEGGWLLEPAVQPTRWIVYMGRLSSPEAVTRKQAELRSLRLPFEALVNPALEPGLSLGAYATQGQAERALAVLAARGVRTARVVQEQAEQTGEWLRLPAVHPTLRARLEALRPLLADKPLEPCP